MDSVPFVDLKAHHQPIAAEIDQAMHRVIANNDFILGKDVQLLETEFAAYCGVKHAVGLDSGISALELSLRAKGIGAGDEVITVSHTFIATVSAISFTGATPVCIDVDAATYNMDPAKIEAAITPKSKAILVVHLYGHAAEMNEINAIAKRHELAVIEDACQSHGATYHGKRVGSLGDAGCFSFYPGKNMGAFGDGGMFVTSNAELAEKIRMLRNYGQKQKYHHAFLAYNRRLDTLQAAVLRVKLPRLDGWNLARENAAKLYDQLLGGIPGIVTPKVAPNRRHVYHLYVIQHPRRNELAQYLKEHGVATGLHYPIPVHQQECYAGAKLARGPLPVTEALAPRILSLPMFPEITPDQVTRVCDLIRQFSR